MADIDVVPKRGTNMWVWIIAAVVLALVVMAMLGVFSGDAANRVGELLTPPAAAPQPAYPVGV